MNNLSIIYTDGGCNKETSKYGEAWGSVVDMNGSDLLESYKEILECKVNRNFDLPYRTQKLKNDTRTIIVAKFEDVKTQNNNGAELMALLAGLRIAKEDKMVKVIRCDSDLLVKWWSNGIISKQNMLKIDKRKLLLIMECTHLRQIFEDRGGTIQKISGDDNLADLGYH